MGHPVVHHAQHAHGGVERPGSPQGRYAREKLTPRPFHGLASPYGSALLGHDTKGNAIAGCSEAASLREASTGARPRGPGRLWGAPFKVRESSTFLPPG